jgi:hypothetical protein
LRSRAAVTVLTLLLITSSQGCGTDESRDGPPFEPGDIEGPESLLITNSDIEGAGASTPYGTVLRWWQALQLGDVKRVKQSYAGRISSREARRQIDGFQPRFSQPIDPEVRTQGKLTNMKARVRTASPLADTPNVVSVRDFTIHFYLVTTRAGYKLRPVSYRNYSAGRRLSRLAVR